MSVIFNAAIIALLKMAEELLLPKLFGLMKVAADPGHRQNLTHFQVMRSLTFSENFSQIRA